MQTEINLSEAVTFVPNKHLPIYNWFYYKEGYAKDLIVWLIEKYKIQGIVLDPFCGSGTTLLACKELGLDSLGYDVSPLAVLASKVKTRNYDLNELYTEWNALKKEKIEFTGNISKERWLRRLFIRSELEKIIGFHERILKIKNEKIQDFFRLALISSVDQCMLAEKRGGSLRLNKHKYVKPIQRVFEKKVQSMLNDLEKQKIKFELEPRVFESDARTQKLEGEFIDAVITSPPYLNKIEYTTVYKAELGLFFKGQETRLRAFVGEEKFKAETESELPLVAQAYFKDMKKVLEQIFEGMKPKGKAFFVLAGGCFPSCTIEADERLAEIGAEIGFKVLEIIECRKIDCYRHSGEKATVRESIVLFEK
ncbi:MAG: DNA methyltransferase [Candidatus Diapherotrites archaeon]|nr:DNA methyltransferase [Candidatus Diapherotrites archaeon]